MHCPNSENHSSFAGFALFRYSFFKLQESSNNSVKIEILSELRTKFGNYLKPNIISVVFGQTEDRCFLETTTSEAGIYDEISRRIDLGFVAGDEIEGDGDYDLYFKPDVSIADNINKFLEDFDEISIINCTDLFTEEAATFIYNYKQEHAETPPRNT